MKLAMLLDVLPLGLVTPATARKIERMAQYISLFHTPWFLQARLPTAAPRLDVSLWNMMVTYEVSKRYKQY